MIDARLENIPKEKFTFVNENKNLTDKELVTKPVGYLRDAWNRFKKNKASIVAAIPVTIIFVFLQRYFISGLTSGAVKE